MHTKSFDVVVQLYVEKTPQDPSKEREILFPYHLINEYDDETEAICFGRQDPRLVKKGLPVEVRKIKFGDVGTGSTRTEDRDEIIPAHAVAVHEQMENFPGPQAKILPYSYGDRFFFVDTSKSMDTRYATNSQMIEVFSIEKCSFGLVPAGCFITYPHVRVAESFEWDTIDGGKMKNEVGDFITIGQRSWVVNWYPESRQKNNDLCTFGRNTKTGYWGVVPIDKVAQLDPSELKTWKSKRLIPTHILSLDKGSVGGSGDENVICDHEDCDFPHGPQPDMVDDMRYHERGFSYGAR